MVVHIKLLGCINRPMMGLARWFYTYFCVAANGLVEQIEDEDYIEDGDYELPDKDWTFNDEEEEVEDENNILCGTTA